MSSEQFRQYWIETKLVDDKMQVNVGGGHLGVFMSHTIDCGKPFKYLGFASWETVMNYQLPGE